MHCSPLFCIIASICSSCYFCSAGSSLSKRLHLATIGNCLFIAPLVTSSTSTCGKPGNGSFILETTAAAAAADWSVGQAGRPYAANSNLSTPTKGRATHVAERPTTTQGDEYHTIDRFSIDNNVLGRLRIDITEFCQSQTGISKRKTVLLQLDAILSSLGRMVAD